MAMSAEHASHPFLGSAYRICKFARANAFFGRQTTHFFVARLAKMYVIPAGMYGSQLWGTGLQAGRLAGSSLARCLRFICIS
jgi:hypothetical protein